MTLSPAAGTTPCRTTEQVWHPYRPMHITNPPPIIRKQAEHAQHTAMMPRAPTHARSSCAPRTVSRPFLWRRVDEQHGPRTSSIFLRAGAKPWVVLGVVLPHFFAAAVAEHCSRDRFFSAQQCRTGPRGGSRLVPTALLMTLKVLRWLYNPHVMSGCGGSAWDHERSFTGAPVGDARSKWT